MKPPRLLIPLLLLLATQCFGNVAISTTTLPNGTRGTAYSAAVKVSGGCTPFKWAIASGALPAGVSAKASSTTTSLNFSGTPTTAANYSFEVKVTGCGGNSAQASYKIAIQASANHIVDVNWDASTSNDVAGYNIYRSPDGSSWKKMNAGLVASTLYTDSTVANGSTYYYAATTVGTDGQESNKTATVKVTVP